MQVFKTFRDLPAAATGAVIVIGNFDGVHKGHRILIDRARAQARTLKAPVGVLTFEPHPRALFRPDDPVFRITPEAVKRRQLAAAGVDILYNLKFDWDFASLSPAQFIDQVLRQGLEPAHIIVGADFCFGQLRKGNTTTLKDAGLAVTAIDKIVDEDGDDVSSSAIRQELRHGNIEGANALLGWEWEMEGIVQKGDQRGRELGFPTANVPLGETLHPAYGIYATYVKIVEDGENSPWLPAATNIGIRPMFELQVGQIESYIFDFDRDIYGKTLRIRPVKRLRGEAKFESLESLIAQIKQDCQDARKILLDA
ncbi:MAG: bifunctional riboflavin kinase/FAD synthetase [Micavibrio aeruginosavorus]|uniref:Riboflavin biosynthesis protein n=1 Tax=Micavibrio aeruginosavorus TaxID=349221 RepID=A0A7T5UH85_9BACT|nr:MAG: bifunctional riboflavin kinase/FAD synthetase [Micavibrio aeruginosavorus]